MSHRWNIEHNTRKLDAATAQSLAAEFRHVAEKAYGSSCKIELSLYGDYADMDIPHYQAVSSLHEIVKIDDELLSSTSVLDIIDDVWSRTRRLEVNARPLNKDNCGASAWAQMKIPGEHNRPTHIFAKKPVLEYYAQHESPERDGQIKKHILSL